MEKIIPFSKDIKFNTKLYEITSISLENTLAIKGNNEIDGEFIISGEYKMNDTSINCEPFIYGIPIDISLDDDYVTETIKIDIDDFKYEIINEEILRVKIDVMIKGNKIEKEKILPDVIIEARNQTLKEDTKDLNKETKITNTENIIENKDLFKEDSNIQSVVKNDDKTSIFDNFDSSKDNYVSYFVHIVRENDSIESIVKKYNSTIDDIKNYNDISKITIGNKIIIPYTNDESI